MYTSSHVKSLFKTIALWSHVWRLLPRLDTAHSFPVSSPLCIGRWCWCWPTTIAHYRAVCKTFAPVWCICVCACNDATLGYNCLWMATAPHVLCQTYLCKGLFIYCRWVLCVYLLVFDTLLLYALSIPSVPAVHCNFAYSLSTAQCNRGCVCNSSRAHLIKDFGDFNYSESVVFGGR